jgi:3-oxoadipate enol-lactonase
VDKLILANTAAQLGPPEAWDARIEAVQKGGMAKIAGSVIERWFTPTFREHSPADVEIVRRTLLSTSPQGYIACCSAIRNMDQRGELALIRSRSLVIAGQQDPATPPALGRQIADAIAGARMIELSAAHLSNIEAAEAFNMAAFDFLRT